jgi:RIO-like serine/threonine protein kinase
LIYLIKNDNGELIIRKCYSSENKADIDLKFITTYKDKTEFILFPNFKKVDNRTVEFDFFQELNLWVYMKQYHLTLEEIDVIFSNIISALGKMYDHKKISLIHGDLFPINIYKKDNYYYLIDFTDSHYYETGFDKYYLLVSLLKAHFGYIKWEIVGKYFTKDKINQYQNYLHDYKNAKYC